MEVHKVIFESAPDGIILVDSGGVITDANPAACRIFGYERSALVGQLIEVLVPMGARGAHTGHRTRFGEGASGPRPMGIGLELEGLRNDGSTIPVEISLAPVEGGTVATVRDVSTRRRMRDFSAGALRAAEDVRSSIARELHDDTAQQLAALMIHLRLLEREESEEIKASRFETIRDGLEAASEGVRRIARGLRPPELEDAGLFAALAAHARNLKEARGLEVAIDTDPVEHLLSPDCLLVTYRIIQEALTNVSRHAGVHQATVRVCEHNGWVLAEIVDQGVGFIKSGDYASGNGMGLMGMHERAAMVGGRLIVESAPDEGTTVRLSIPVAPKQETTNV